jgi:hypothetical protein
MELWEEVEKDTKRTRSEMHLFQSKTDSGNLYMYIYIGVDYPLLMNNKKREE